MNRVLIFLFAVLPSLSFAQRYIYVNGIAGNYWMHGMRELQEELRADLAVSGIPGKAVLRFPSSLQGEIGLDFTIHDHLLRAYRVGGFVNYTLTEGLISYSDYSGEMSIQQLINRVAIGARGIRAIGKDLSAYAKIGFSISSLDIISKTSLQGGASDEDDIAFSAAGLVAEPGIQWSKIYHRFAFTAHGGYEINVNGKTHYNEESHLIDDSGDPIKIDWSGFRLGIGVAFEL